MNTSEVVKNFQIQGWIVKLDVDRYAEKNLGDRIVQVLFKLKSLGEYQKFEASYSVKSTDFSVAVKEIEGDRSDYNDTLKVNFRDDVRLQVPKVAPEYIEIVCVSAIEWAKTVDITKRYEELCNIDSSTPGAAGVWHLAALCLMGSIDKLTSYQVRFEEGDNCGFVPFITKDYIDRAVVFAKRKQDK